MQAHSREQERVAIEIANLKEQLVTLQLRLQKKSSASSSRPVSRPSPDLSTLLNESTFIISRPIHHILCNFFLLAGGN